MGENSPPLIYATISTLWSFPLSRKVLLQRTNLVSTRPTYANGRVWGLFSQMCYSHQTELVKSQHVVLQLKHFWESEDQADDMLESLFLSVHIPPSFLAFHPHYFLHIQLAQVL